MKRIIIGLVLIVALGAGIWMAYRFASEGVVVEISQQEIQQQLDRQFPVARSYLLLTVELMNPQVTLKEGANRIHFGVDVAATVPVQPPFRGSGEISGEVRYEPAVGQFFLENSRIEELNIPGVPENYRPQVQQVIDGLTREYLDRQPIYQLKADDVRHSVAQLFLQSVTVGDGKLRIHLGIRPVGG
jgi:hypothetical protein